MKKILLITFVILGITFMFTNKIGAKMNNNFTEVRAEHILVDSEQKALDIKKEIENNGMTFEDAAKEYSNCPSKANGGDLGFFGRGIMVKEFENAAFEATPKKITDPIQTQFGWHLIKVTDRR